LPEAIRIQEEYPDCQAGIPGWVNGKPETKKQLVRKLVEPVAIPGVLFLPFPAWIGREGLAKASRTPDLQVLLVMGTG
jgi:hypothetical protein